MLAGFKLRNVTLQNFVPIHEIPKPGPLVEIPDDLFFHAHRLLLPALLIPRAGLMVHQSTSPCQQQIPMVS